MDKEQKQAEGQEQEQEEQEEFVNPFSSLSEMIADWPELDTQKSVKDLKVGDYICLYTTEYEPFVGRYLGIEKHPEIPDELYWGVEAVRTTSIHPVWIPVSKKPYFEFVDEGYYEYERLNSLKMMDEHRRNMATKMWDKAFKEGKFTSPSQLAREEAEREKIDNALKANSQKDKNDNTGGFPKPGIWIPK